MTERDIFLEALERATPEARSAYLQEACGPDAALRRKVDQLLEEHFSNDSLLAGSALERERATMAIPWLADVTPFVVLSGDQFAAPPPPRLGSGLYRTEYDEVKALGALIGSSRTPEQTQIAYFWADNFPAQMNRIVRNVAETHVESSADRARLFALVWLGVADALINTCSLPNNLLLIASASRCANSASFSLF